LREKNVVIPPHKKKISADFEGAWVKEPVPGMYGWTVSLDFASLYPSIIRQWNMSPETIIGVKENTSINSFICENVETPEDYTIAANGSMYRKDIHGIIPEVIKVVIDGRKIAKKAMQELEKNNGSDNEIASLNGKQLAFKVLANALYGALSNIGFRYYDLRIAEAITLTGQASDRHVEKTLNEYMNKILKTENKDYVTYGDTDSIYLNVQPLVDSFCADKSIDDTVKFLDKVCDTKIQEQVNKSVDQIFEIGNCYEKIMDMKREVIASRAIWTAKKRYAMMVHNSEGIDYKPYKLKIMGLDLIKSSTPQEIRKLLKESLVTIFEKDESELQKFVSQVKQKFMKMSVENIAFPRSANDLEKYHNDKSIYGSKCPVQVRGALLYNHYLKSNNDIVKIKSGDKIKFVYLKMPNKIREDVISFPSHSSLPKELDLHKYINYELMWEKVFLSPLKGITDAIDWSPEKRATLDALFG
jgi:DNA polymerase elongation subunit (family B)